MQEPAPEAPEGMTLRDPAAWNYLPRDVKRAGIFLAVAGGCYVVGFPSTFLPAAQDVRWLAVVAIVLGAAGLVATIGYALKWWGDDRRLVRALARRVTLCGAALLIAMPLGYWLFVIPRL